MAGYPPNSNQPPQQPAYPPQQGHPQQPPPGYPPQQQNHPPQQGAYPPQGAPAPYGHGAPQGPPQGGAYPASLPTECFGGFWIRFVSYILDAILLSIPNFIIGLAFGAASVTAAEAGGGQGAALGMQQMSSLITLGLGLFYFVFMEVKYGGTLGKMAVGLRVVDENGVFLTPGRSIGRYFAKVLSVCTIMIGFIMAGFHDKKRALHDNIAGTYVIRKEYARQQ